MKKKMHIVKFLLYILPLICLVLRCWRNPNAWQGTTGIWYICHEWARNMISSNNISLGLVRVVTDHNLLQGDLSIIKIPIGYLTWCTMVTFYFIPFDLFNWFLNLGRKELDKE